ncbi:putative cytochrome P450 superfamily protein isoform X4 [Iris pallida]|uniref:Cytochrome P450 superfamily protein isoform X4 n=1 Tax=Iris pallida TaxID=29817 RepID=A0AAX6I5S8_IRIPA|nr:putative cytochrome P450 superfamily protein isoform X4 [Iris pallida]
MEALSPSSSPSSPRRHIHSSFPYYFYSTPATPSSDRRLSAFVALCESRLATEAAPAPPSDSDSGTTAGFAFGGFNRSESFDFDLAFADDIFREGRLLPVDPADAQPQPPAAAASPLKPPPRLQHIANIRKSLRMRRRGSRVAGRKADDDDPFAVAVEKVTRDSRDAGPWWWSRRSNVRETDGDDDAAAAKAKRRGIVECVKIAISAKDKKRKNDHVLGREEESAWLIRKPSSSNNGNLVGLARRTTVVNTHYGSTLLACFGFK